MTKPAALVISLLATSSLRAQDAVSPAVQTREMNALFICPYTVDQGHFQIETYLVGYAYARDRSQNSDTRTTIWNVGHTTLKYGLSRNADVELSLRPYTKLRTEDRIAHSVDRQSGFGDLVFKTKLNLLGNDDGPTAIALLPSLKIPTAQDHLGNDAVEGGLAVPIARELPCGWWVFLSPELSLVQQSDGTGYSGAFADTLTLWHEIVGKLSGYVDFANWVAFDAAEEWYGTVDAGLTYMLNPNVQLDLGVLFGVTHSAPDVNPFLGLSVRF